MQTITRREFNQFSLGSVAGLVFPAATGVAFSLFDLVSNPGAALAVGKTYLWQHPEFASPSRLLEQLALPRALRNLAHLSRAIDRRIRSDFENQRVIVLDGWLVARSEAAICGLIALG